MSRFVAAFAAAFGAAVTQCCPYILIYGSVFRKVILSDRELELVRRLQAGAFPHPEFAAEPDYSDYYTHEVSAELRMS